MSQLQILICTDKDILSKTWNAYEKCQCDGRWQNEALGLEMVPLFGVK